IRLQQDRNLEDLIYNCDLLIIDDFGIEVTNDYTYLDLFNMLNKKMLYNKKMLISTNLILENLLEKYEERIYSRLIGGFKFHKFLGEDLRIELSNKKPKKIKENNQS
ncbi:MAG: DnaA/Hda family protein, partial [Oscillospiraceae bacterium]|nr:DnaA/Hda family protein [Oscillospiraceae bacterium]